MQALLHCLPRGVPATTRRRSSPPLPPPGPLPRQPSPTPAVAAVQQVASGPSAAVHSATSSGKSLTSLLPTALYNMLILVSLQAFLVKQSSSSSSLLTSLPPISLTPYSPFSLSVASDTSGVSTSLPPISLTPYSPFSLSVASDTSGVSTVPSGKRPCNSLGKIGRYSQTGWKLTTSQLASIEDTLASSTCHDAISKCQVEVLGRYISHLVEENMGIFEFGDAMLA